MVVPARKLIGAPVKLKIRTVPAAAVPTSFFPSVSIFFSTGAATSENIAGSASVATSAVCVCTASVSSISRTTDSDVGTTVTSALGNTNTRANTPTKARTIAAPNTASTVLRFDSALPRISSVSTPDFRGTSENIVSRTCTCGIGFVGGTVFATPGFAAGAVIGTTGCCSGAVSPAPTATAAGLPTTAISEAALRGRLTGTCSSANPALVAACCPRSSMVIMRACFFKISSCFLSIFKLSGSEKIYDLRGNTKTNSLRVSVWILPVMVFMSSSMLKYSVLYMDSGTTYTDVFIIAATWGASNGSHYAKPSRDRRLATLRSLLDSTCGCVNGSTPRRSAP